MLAALAGGVGAARLLSGLVRVVDPASITAIVNTADDVVLHGLHVSPDLDTVTYTLAGEINPDTGWGLRDETWQAMDTVRRYGGISWFNLGDRDLGTHLYRTQRLREGATLTQATGEIVAAWGLRLRVLPVTDDRLETRVTVEGEGEIGFQEYFVQRRHDVAVTEVRFDGADTAEPGPGVLDAITTAERVVVCPSNPIVSIGPLLAVAGVGGGVE
jgi:LPPG:FO 2-phospho-L-lactate transferase